MINQTLQNIFIKNKNNQIKESDVEPAEIIDKNLSYEQYGFTRAGTFHGQINGFKICLGRVIRDHQHKQREDDATQLRLKEPYRVALAQKEVEMNHNNEQISTLREKLKSLETDKTVQQTELDRIKENPRSIMPDRMSKISLIIGAVILVALTVYLFIFYSSASYSAFFKEFKISELAVANSIFDPKALSEAMRTGFTVFILIISMPFVFIGLGFLIHKFQESDGYSKYFKIFLLILVTFIFDAILAYEITEKIYNLRAVNGIFDQDMPKYDFSLAFSSVNFWLIIFAGFIVYLIWGFVFDFTIEAYEKLDVVSQAKRTKERIIREIDLKITETNKIITDLKAKNMSLEHKMIDINSKINGIVLEANLFKNVLQQFVQGWTAYMTQAGHSAESIKALSMEAEGYIINGITDDNQ